MGMRTTKPEDADLIIQKLPSDMGIHRNPRKGTLDAPDRILEDFESTTELMIDEVFPDEFNLEETHTRIEDNTQELAGYGKPILSIGGDHSVSYPVIKALKQVNPDMKLVWLDSHLDLKEKVDGHVSHDVVVRELLQYFEEDEIYFLGVTRKDEDEKQFLEEHDLKVVGPEEAEETSKEIDGEVYLSVDIDVLKQELAPGTGYPDGNMSLEQVEAVMTNLDIAHADLVEVAPSLDTGETLRSARILLEYLKKRITA